MPLEDGHVTDDPRVRAAIPTLRWLPDHGARVICCSHLGRPKGARPEVLAGAGASATTSHLGTEVLFVDDVAGDQTRQAAEALGEGQVLEAFQNRYEPGESELTRTWPTRLASLAEVYVTTLGAAHRAHASVVGVAERLPAYAGYLLANEVKVLSRLLEDPERPFAAVLKGKVSDKLAVLDNLLSRVDSLVVGGGMCFTFLAAQGHEIGDSLFEPDQVEAVRQLLETAGSQGKPVLLPTDVVVAREVSEDAETRTVPADGIEGRLEGPGHRPGDGQGVRRRRRRRPHRVLERPDGRVRAGPVRRRHQGGRRGGGRRRRLHGGRRGRLGRRPGRARPGRPGRPPSTGAALAFEPLEGKTSPASPPSRPSEGGPAVRAAR